MKGIQFVNIVQLILVFQSLFFSLFLFSQKRGKLISNRILGAFLGVLAVHMILNFLFETKSQQVIPDITSTLGFIYGPLIYLFIVSHIYKELSFWPKQIFHLIPWGSSVAISLTSPWVTDYLGVGIFLSLIIYISLSFTAISKYQKVLRYTQSKFDSIALNWIKNVLYLFLGISIFETIRNFIIPHSLLLENFFYALLVCALLVFVVTLVFKGLRQPEIFKGITIEDEAIASSVHDKYNSSNMLDVEAEKVAATVQKFLETKKNYLNPDLNLEELAKEISIPSRVLSQVINSQFEKNFSEFINEFRIGEAKILLSNSLENKKTVLEIVYESGFNSKSNFYTAFKQETGVTPLQFKSTLGTK